MAAAKKSTKKSTAKKPAKKSGISHNIENLPFAPGDQVTVHESHAIIAEQQIGREPISDPVTKATVKQDGTLSINVPKKGSYAVAGPDPRPGSDKTAYLTVTVK